MASPKTAGVSAEHHEKSTTPQVVPIMDEKYASGQVREIQTTSVALAAAVAAQKPSLLSKNMLKLYFIMAIGYDFIASL